MFEYATTKMCGDMRFDALPEDGVMTSFLRLKCGKCACRKRINLSFFYEYRSYVVNSVPARFMYDQVFVLPYNQVVSPCNYHSALPCAHIV